MKRFVCASLALFAGVSLLSADYYVVESNGDAYPAQKTAKGYEPISDRPSFTSSLSPGYVDTVYFFDPDIGGWYYPNRDSNTVVMQLFATEYYCSLGAVGVNYYSAGWAEFYVWEGPDTIPACTEELRAHLEANWQYDSIAHAWITWPTVLYGPELIGSDEPYDWNARWCWIDLKPNLCVAGEAMWVGYRILESYPPVEFCGRPWPMSDSWVDPGGYPPRFRPCRSWMYREQPGTATDNQWIGYGDISGDWQMKYVIDMMTPPDVGPISISSPPTHVFVDSTYSPAAVIQNFGCHSIDTISVVCRIDSWTDTTKVAGLRAMESDTAEFTDWTVPDSGTYSVTVCTRYAPDGFPANDTISKEVYATYVGVQEAFLERDLSSVCDIAKSFPNPMREATTVLWQVTERCRVKLEVFDHTGMLVTILVEGQIEPGYYHTQWNGKDHCCRKVPSGTYFLRLAIRPAREAHTGQAGNYSATRKVCVVR